MQAEALVKAQDDLRETTGHLGMTLIKLAKFEREQATCNSLRRRAGEIHNFANSVLKMSRSQIKLNSEIVKHLVCLYVSDSIVGKCVDHLLLDLSLTQYNKTLFVFAGLHP